MRCGKCDDGATDAITLKRLSKCCDADAITLKRWSKCNIWAFQIREERGTLKRVTVLLVTRCCFLRDAATTSFKIAGSPETETKLAYYLSYLTIQECRNDHAPETETNWLVRDTIR